jgi:hypothetical protein
MRYGWACFHDGFYLLQTRCNSQAPHFDANGRMFFHEIKTSAYGCIGRLLLRLRLKRQR